MLTSEGEKGIFIWRKQKRVLLMAWCKTSLTNESNECLFVVRTLWIVVCAVKL